MNERINLPAYDSSLNECYSFYDQLPYERNIAVCGNDCVRMYSGNVVKSYAYTEVDAKEVPNQDHRVLEMIKRQEALAQLEEE